MKSVFFIPTNRDCSECIGSFVEELTFALHKTGRSIPLVVTETDQSPAAQRNAEAMRELAAHHPELEIIHIPVGVQKHYYDALFSQGGLERIEGMFRSQSVNYGTAMNKLFLFTGSLGAEAFHRRDSDTRLLFHGVEGARRVFPIEVELAYLGKRVRETDLGQGAEERVQDQPICVVGGNYFGEWNLDVKDFAMRSFDIVYRLYTLLGFDPAVVKPICDEIFPIDPILEEKEELTLVTSVSNAKNPDCGNVAVWALHEQLPTLAGHRTLAADYFVFDTATALGLPAVHHTRPVFHMYTSQRFEHEPKLRYWKGVMKFADYFNLYMSIFSGAADGWSQRPVDDTVRQDLARRIRAFAKEDARPRKGRMLDIAREILLPFDERYAALGRTIIDEVDELVEEANREYELHAELIEAWPDLIRRAKSIDLRELIRRHGQSG